MNTSDVKINLIQRIAQLKEPGITAEIQKLLDFELASGDYILTNSQKTVLQKGMKNIKTLHFLLMIRLT
ncbi:hypothetical protein [uncultured Chryseobacterium sp.]|uniref:hypothetical protein n=1 Tax=uncultured Chryseobacterium sp. TaxID=259322 RepID=UPI0025F89CFB|nr:hypothetical protein [uncultured Chryseobacterium sp.]